MPNKTMSLCLILSEKATSSPSATKDSKTENIVNKKNDLNNNITNNKNNIINNDLNNNNPENRDQNKSYDELFKEYLYIFEIKG